MKNKTIHISINLFVLLFCLIPYIMEGGFYWLDLKNDHLSDTYTTFCLAVFGMWVHIAHVKNWLNNYIAKFTFYYIELLFLTWTILTLVLDTTLGFNNWTVDSIIIYGGVAILTYAILYISKVICKRYKKV